MVALIRPECPNPAALAAGNYKESRNKDVLRASTSEKCMYCESKIEHNSFAHVEHIKPKVKYPEFEFIWDNLGYSCERCNINKGDEYEEQTPFINPYQDNPEDHIVFFGFFAFPKQGSERGEYTIKKLQLNRAGLIEARKERIEKIDMMIKATFRTTNALLRTQALAEIQQEAEKDREYSQAVKCLLVIQRILPLGVTNA
ncbi:MAG: HNH endonuclease [Treponema sp.]|jgi:uncharacterized protein (TIGR02646 family)|nr:HNH endonuclease [Treponema sp.]